MGLLLLVLPPLLLMLLLLLLLRVLTPTRRPAVSIFQYLIATNCALRFARVALCFTEVAEFLCIGIILSCLRLRPRLRMVAAMEGPLHQSLILSLAVAGSQVCAQSLFRVAHATNFAHHVQRRKNVLEDVV